MSGQQVEGDARDSVTLPQKLLRYVIDCTGPHQVAILALTVVVFLIEVVPLELQRRIVNDAVKGRQFTLILTLCAIYAGVSLAHGGIKLGLNVYRAWVAQRATRDLRRRVRALESETESRPGSQADERGVEISMIVAEAEPIGLFVAEALSEPLLQGGILCSVLAYMIHIDPIMTLIAVGIFLPQLLFVPLMQVAINRRTKKSISLLRILSASLTDPAQSGGERQGEDNTRIDRVFSLSMGVFRLKYSMNFLMNLCTHLQIVAALLYGSHLVLTDQLQVGGVVAFISGVTRLTDPWGDLVNYFRDVSLTRVKYLLLADTANQIAQRHGAQARTSGEVPSA